MSMMICMHEYYDGDESHDSNGMKRCLVVQFEDVLWDISFIFEILHFSGPVLYPARNQIDSSFRSRYFILECNDPLGPLTTKSFKSSLRVRTALVTAISCYPHLICECPVL